MIETIACPKCGNETRTAQTHKLSDRKTVVCAKCRTRFLLGDGRELAKTQPEDGTHEAAHSNSDSIADFLTDHDASMPNIPERISFQDAFDDELKLAPQVPEASGLLPVPPSLRVEEVSANKSRPVVNTNTKQCPFCAEQIAFAAIKCKHCGEMLNATDATATNFAATVEIQVKEESALIILVNSEYEKLFLLSKQAILNVEGKIKKDSLSEGTILGGWKYGINPFGLSVSLEIATCGNNWYRVSGKGFFSDAFDTFGSANKKARLVISSLKSLLAEEAGCSVTYNAAAARTQSTSDPFSGGTANPYSAPLQPINNTCAESNLCRMSFILSGIGFLFFGIVLAPVAFVLAIVALSKGEPNSVLALVLSLASFIFSVFVASLMLSL